MQLVRYEAARKALAAARRIDEVKAIRDKAVAMEAYAKQAKDTELIDTAIDIKRRAERRAGELLQKTAATGERATQGRQRSHDATFAPPVLADIGVSKTQSSRWQQLAQMDEAQFEARLSAAKREAVKAIELPAAERTAEKQTRRQERETQLAEATREASEKLGERLYGVIYADPPWRFEPWSRETGMDRAADNHYPTLNLDAIKALRVPSAPDCVLFLWATAPMLPQALEVMAAWRFEYKAHCIWQKTHAGTGYWFRSAHELLLVGTRGDVPAPAPGMQYISVITAAAAEHSVKPPAFAEMIEHLFPTVPRLELFARGSRLGWDTWGNEART